MSRVRIGGSKHVGSGTKRTRRCYLQNGGESFSACHFQHGGEEGAEELVRDGPQLLFALLRFLCRPGRWSTRLKLQRPPEGSAQVDGNVAKIDLAARGVDGALVHFNAPSWAVRAVMSSTTLPVCPKTGSTSPSLTVHLCLHTALLREIGNAPPGGVSAHPGFVVTSPSTPARHPSQFPGGPGPVELRLRPLLTAAERPSRSSSPTAVGPQPPCNAPGDARALRPPTMQRP